MEKQKTKNQKITTSFSFFLKYLFPHHGFLSFLFLFSYRSFLFNAMGFPQMVAGSGFLFKLMIKRLDCLIYRYLAKVFLLW